jgi:hypothetical protein
VVDRLFSTAGLDEVGRVDEAETGVAACELCDSAQGAGDFVRGVEAFDRLVPHAPREFGGQIEARGAALLDAAAGFIEHP